MLNMLCCMAHSLINSLHVHGIRVGMIDTLVISISACGNVVLDFLLNVVDRKRGFIMGQWQLCCLVRIVNFSNLLLKIQDIGNNIYVTPILTWKLIHAFFTWNKKDVGIGKGCIWKYSNLQPIFLVF